MSLRPTTSRLTHVNIARLNMQARPYSAPTSDSIPPSKAKLIPQSGTYPRGFLAGSTHVGIKASNTRFNDLALIASERPCSAAAVFTQNKFAAAPVQLDKRILKERSGAGIRGVIANSGCANAVTGNGGLEDAVEMSRRADEALVEKFGADSKIGGTESSGESTLVMSTGVIGQRLPVPKISSRVPALTETLDTTHDAWLSVARAITTTDTIPKLRSRTFTLPSYPGNSFSIAGMAKGAGMIHPNMATLLGIIATDAPIDGPACQALISHATECSFNCISIDGDTSTNDTVALLANGAAIPRAAWHRPVTLDRASHADFEVLQNQITALSAELAQLLVRDGEGATKFVTLRVRGRQDWHDRRKLAASIAKSPLVKTAMYGGDPNWGRILCAIGYADRLPEEMINPSQVSVSFLRKTGAGEPGEELKLLVDGDPVAFDEGQAAEILKEEDLEVLIRLDGDKGKEEDDMMFWTCDFSHEYVTINADYRT